MDLRYVGSTLCVDDIMAIRVVLVLSFVLISHTHILTCVFLSLPGSHGNTSDMHVLILACTAQLLLILFHTHTYTDVCVSFSSWFTWKHVRHACSHSGLYCLVVMMCQFGNIRLHCSLCLC